MDVSENEASREILLKCKGGNPVFGMQKLSEINNPDDILSNNFLYLVLPGRVGTKLCVRALGPCFTQP